MQVDEVQEHIIVPEYPDTKDFDTRILHFIHYPNPIPPDVQDLDDENEVKSRIGEVFTKFMSQV